MAVVTVQQLERPGDVVLREKFGTPDVQTSDAISPDLARYLESLSFFFISTSDKRGECDASFRSKRGRSLLLKIMDGNSIVFPDYLGNGSFRSLGNILENPHIGMLFIDLRSGLRIRVNGEAQVSDDLKWLDEFPGSIQVVKVRVREVYKQNRPVELGRSFGR